MPVLPSAFAGVRLGISGSASPPAQSTTRVVRALVARGAPGWAGDGGGASDHDRCRNDHPPAVPILIVVLRFARRQGTGHPAPPPSPAHPGAITVERGERKATCPVSRRPGPVHWMEKERLVGRQNVRYFERVVDPSTGEVVHCGNHRRSEHHRFGSAKEKTRAQEATDVAAGSGRDSGLSSCPCWSPAERP